MGTFWLENSYTNQEASVLPTLLLQGIATRGRLCPQHVCVTCGDTWRHICTPRRREMSQDLFKLTQSSASQCFLTELLS